MLLSVDTMNIFNQ